MGYWLVIMPSGDVPVRKFPGTDDLVEFIRRHAGCQIFWMVE